ncbi:MAG: PepSY-associated TM helix domain-containing protein [Pseudomonadota bacterium]|nr:PepSY-associated TM helix domain-containing protein [Pseudomonadota bacterium]
MFKLIFLFSRFIHKYLGLIALVYFLGMGVSGILLNHPTLLQGFSLPLGWMPDSYQFRNWNRWSLRDAAFSKQQPEKIYVAGKDGVWMSRNAGRNFTPMSSGLPASAYLRDTNCLLLVENHNPIRLYAGTRNGLYYCSPDLARWQAVQNPELQKTEIIDLLKTDQEIFVFTKTDCFVAPLSEQSPVFGARELKTPPGFKPRAPFFRFMLKLHDGSLFGLTGRMVADIVGLILIFLSLSAFYLWYVPWRRRQTRGYRRNRPRYYKFFYRYHLKLGIYASFFLILIALTGMFLRPPLLIAIVRIQTPKLLQPANPTAKNQLGRIHQAAWLKSNNKLYLTTQNGIFYGPPDGSKPFSAIKNRLPIHGMGATVFEPLADNSLLIGSFSGLFKWQPETGKVTNLTADKSPRRRRFGGAMVAAAGVDNGTPRFWCDYRRGLQPLPGKIPTLTEIQAGKLTSSLTMPKKISKKSRISLWHLLFEFHNGRIFRNLLGRYTWLLIPLGGLALLITVISGTYDWFYRRKSH